MLLNNPAADSSWNNNHCWNFVDDNEDVSDLDVHGSMVSGIMAAVANNGLGIAGVAPEAKIMPLKLLELMVYGMV